MTTITRLQRIDRNAWEQSRRISMDLYPSLSGQDLYEYLGVLPDIEIEEDRPLVGWAPYTHIASATEPERGAGRVYFLARVRDA